MKRLRVLPHRLRVYIDCVRYRLPLKEWKRYYEGRKFARQLLKEPSEQAQDDLIRQRFPPR